MIKLNRLVDIGLEMCKDYDKVDTRNIKWADSDILDMLDKYGDFEYAVAFWSCKIYVNTKELDYDKSKVLYVPCATKYNRYIIVNPDDYPKDVQIFERALEWLDKNFS